MCNDSGEVEVCLTSIMSSAEVEIHVTSTDEAEDAGMYNVQC